MATKAAEKETMSLVLENGEEIQISYPTEIADGLFEEMQEAQSKDGFWWIGNYMDATAMYKGFSIDHINMKRVIGFS